MGGSYAHVEMYCTLNLLNRKARKRGLRSAPANSQEGKGPEPRQIGFEEKSSKVQGRREGVRVSPNSFLKKGVFVAGGGKRS